MAEISVKIEAVESKGKIVNKFIVISQCLCCSKKMEQEIQNMYLTSIPQVTLSLCGKHNECPICRKKGTLYMDPGASNVLVCRTCGSRLDRNQFEALKRNFNLAYTEKKTKKTTKKKGKKNGESG